MKSKRIPGMRRFIPLMLTILVLIGCQTSRSDKANTQWITTWATATEDIREGFWMAKGHFPPKPLKNDTLRMFMRTSVGGDTIRLKFSNAFGTSPVTIQRAHIAQAASADASATNGAINTHTDSKISFNGQSQVVIAPGATLYSDPLDFALSPLEVVAVSIQYADIEDKPITGHRGARTTSFFATGNRVSEPNMQDAIKKDVWYSLTAIEVKAPQRSATVVAMGDSITDGYGTKYNHHTRWTDYLAERMSQHPDTAHIAMANVGIGGAGAGMSVERFQRDVLDIQGAGWVMIFIGINDIVYGRQISASDVINHYKKMADMAHANGLKVYGATITPMGSHSQDADKEAVRQQINQWIRSTAITSDIYDGFIDFDQVARDPQRPQFLLPAYAVDDLHLNITGYKALADAVELGLFSGQ